jgi:hypothetical protein
LLKEKKNIMKNNLFISWFEIIIEKLSWAVVAHNFYYWFLIPILPNVPQLTYFNVLGLMLLLYAFLPKNLIINNFASEDEIMSVRVSLIFNPWIVLSIGYVLSLFI